MLLLLDIIWLDRRQSEYKFVHQFGLSAQDRGGEE